MVLSDFEGPADPPAFSHLALLQAVVESVIRDRADEHDIADDIRILHSRAEVAILQRHEK